MTEPIVSTLAGAVRGKVLPEGGALFAGIPFAAPPLGPLRLRPPQPPAAWTGLRPATEFAPAPAQVGFGGSGLRLVEDEGAEDCLYLNVWTPGGAGPHPVIVWIYGGGFEIGSASPPQTDAARLARNTNTVVVAANYRVGALGFAHLADFLGPECTNLGFQDQIAALRWVRANIANFGGDPAKVTVAGESAGAFSIGTLFGMPAATGLFDRAILHSGSTSRVCSATIAAAIATDLLAALHVTRPEQLAEVPVACILAAQKTVIDGEFGRRNLPGGRSWGAVLDGHVLPVHPQEAVRAGTIAHIPLLVGANREEFTLFEVLGGADYRPADEAALLAEVALAGSADPTGLLAAYRKRLPDADLTGLRTAFLTDVVYRLPASALAAAQVAAGGRAHAFLLTAQPAGAELGAHHGADLAYVFDQLDRIGAGPKLGDTAENRAVRDAMQAGWASFAATGDPGWPSYTDSLVRQFGGDADHTIEPPDDAVGRLWRAAGRVR